MKKDYIWERIYPHIISTIIVVILISISFDPIKSKKIDSLVEGIVTLDSIIIGFMGAIIPVILSMKNESKLVKYVFEKDDEGLFKKYLSETIAYGLVDVCVSLLIYIRDIITNRLALKVVSIIFIYAFFTFILSTYRSLSCMLKLIFSDDTKINSSVSDELDRNDSEKLWEERGK